MPPHEDPSQDDRAGDPGADPGDGALGRRLGGHRQRRKTLAPFVCGMFGGSITLTIVLIAEDGPLVDHAWRIALVLIPLGVVVGLLFDHFAPVDHRVRVDVHEHGVRIRRGEGRPVVCVPALVAAVEDPGLPADRRLLALVWPTPTGGTAWARLDSFGGARSLRRALVDGRPPRVPPRARAAAAVVAAVVLLPLYVRLLVPGPITVPEEHEHLRAFCADPEMVFEDLPAYTGEGPHPIALVSERDYPMAVSEATPLSPGTPMADRGWSTDMAGAALIACGRIDLGETLDTCTYTESFTGLPTDHDLTVPLYTADFEYELYEAATHRHVATLEVAGTPVEEWECPPTIAANRDAAVVEQDLGPLVDAFAPYVEGTAGG